MSEVNELAVVAGGADARAGLRAALALRRLAERLEMLQVSNARRQGWSWQEIAEALEVSKQAVHQKHAAHAAQPAASPNAASPNAASPNAGTPNAGIQTARAAHGRRSPEV